MVHSLIKECGLLSTSPELADGDGAILAAVKARLATASELYLYHDKPYIDFVLTHQAQQVDARSSVFGIEDVC